MLLISDKKISFSHSFFWVSAWAQKSGITDPQRFSRRQINISHLFLGHFSRALIEFPATRRERARTSHGKLETDPKASSPGTAFLRSLHFSSSSSWSGRNLLLDSLVHSVVQLLLSDEHSHSRKDPAKAKNSLECPETAFFNPTNLIATKKIYKKGGKFKARSSCRN